ncbi:MAG: hypothetical protein DBX59_01330 [Bacillota bacterium]|nr:MAG: hypothetical protein DBX59_01330 [Bacillota bacterium]
MGKGKKGAKFVQTAQKQRLFFYIVVLLVQEILHAVDEPSGTGGKLGVFAVAQKDLGFHPGFDGDNAELGMMGVLAEFGPLHMAVGKDRHTQALGDQVQDGVPVVAGKDNVGHNTRLFTGRHHNIVQRGAAFQGDEILLLQLAQRDRRALPQRMPGGQQCHQMIPQIGDFHQISVIGGCRHRFPHQCQLTAAGAQRFFQGGGVLLQHLDGLAGVAGAVFQ